MEKSQQKLVLVLSQLMHYAPQLLDLEFLHLHGWLRELISRPQQWLWLRERGLLRWHILTHCGFPVNRANPSAIDIATISLGHVMILGNWSTLSFWPLTIASIIEGWSEPKFTKQWVIPACVYLVTFGTKLYNVRRKCYIPPIVPRRRQMMLCYTSIWKVQLPVKLTCTWYL